jgi:hypothetical protein
LAKGLTVTVSTTKQITDKQRIDWLADVNNNIGNVMLPTECVHDNIDGGLRAAIDAAMCYGCPDAGGGVCCGGVR